MIPTDEGGGFLQKIKDKVTGGGVKKDPAGLFDFSAGEAGQVPGTGNVTQAYLQGKQLYGNALVKFNQERTSTAQGFGYQGDIDPTSGAMTNLRVDQTNPYGGYQLDRRSHADQWQALRDQQAGRRIGGKGLGAQAQSDARFNWGGEDSQHAQDFIGRLAGLDQGQQQAYQGWQDTYWNALSEQTRNAIEKENFDPATPDATAGSKPPTPGQKKLVAQQLAKKTKAKPAPVKKQYLPGQAPTSLAVKNNTSTTAKKKK